MMTYADSELIDGCITYTEALAALRKMKNNKSPGSDKWLVESFKFFFVDIGYCLVRSINGGFAKEKVAVVHAKVLLHVFIRKKQNQSTI